LKKIVFNIVQNGSEPINLDGLLHEQEHFANEIANVPGETGITLTQPTHIDVKSHEHVEESLSIADREKDLIKKALEKYRGRRRKAAQELGISERTLYRKISEYGINA
jgi:DNA-binding NtrC family response regulator